MLGGGIRRPGREKTGRGQSGPTPFLSRVWLAELAHIFGDGVGLRSAVTLGVSRGGRDIEAPSVIGMVCGQARGGSCDLCDARTVRSDGTSMAVTGPPERGRGVPVRVRCCEGHSDARTDGRSIEGYLDLDG